MSAETLTPFEQWYLRKEKRINRKLRKWTPWDKFTIANDVAWDWYSSPLPSVVTQDLEIPLASADHFECFWHDSELEATEVISYPTEHLPQHLADKDLGPIIQLAFQVLNIYKEEETKELYALLSILFGFESGCKAVYSKFVRESEAFFACDFPALGYLATDDAIAFLQVKKIDWNKVQIGPISASELE